MSFHEYTLKFTKFLKYFPSLVFDPRDKMSRSVTRVLDDLQEHCHSAIPHDNMNISCLMEHAKHVKVAKTRRKSRDAKRAKSYDGGSSSYWFEVQYKPRFNKRV